MFVSASYQYFYEDSLLQKTNYFDPDRKVCLPSGHRMLITSFTELTLLQLGCENANTLPLCI